MRCQPKQSRHELSILQLRLERKIEARVLDKLKKTLQIKLQSRQPETADKSGNIPAA